MRLITVHVYRYCGGNIDSSFCCVHSKHEPPHCSVLALRSQHTPIKSPVKLSVLVVDLSCQLTVAFTANNTSH